MRLRQCRMKRYYLKKYQSEKDEEGNIISSFSSPVEIHAEIWPAGGQLQAQIYGARLQYILNMNFQGDTEINERDGICVHVNSENSPDYRVISIKNYFNHQFIELEKI